MREFFHGWRRMVGGVVLVMACAFMGLWTRSQQMRDSVQVRIADNAAYLFIWNESELVWQSLHLDLTETIQLRRFAILGISVPDNHRHFYDRRQKAAAKEDYLHSVSFKPMGDSWRESEIKLAAWTIPHWSVVLPLTLLSAYLILWKPWERVPCCGWSCLRK